ncbi:MAG TPA: hypothetical protein VE079_15970 [Ensifer sp.]|nr:hypothetical protein [Ensifer sp.]
MSIPKKIDATKTYAIKLSRTVTVGKHVYRPLNELQAEGQFLLDIIAAEGEEAIDYARPV